MRILDRLVSLCRFEFLARRWGKKGHFKDLDNGQGISMHET